MNENIFLKFFEPLKRYESTTFRLVETYKVEVSHPEGIHVVFLVLFRYLRSVSCNTLFMEFLSEYNHYK